ncbi:MAG: hypothetical protein GX428_11125 [Candidatus Atribacteria bacterium]|nr:hypothetical protein [Candidatus Atribacteria bacterium]
MKNYKLLLFIAIICALFGALIVLPSRLKNESVMKEIEVVCDWQDIEVISLRLGKPVEEILDELKQVGVSAIGVSDYDLKNLQQLGKVLPVVVNHDYPLNLRYFYVSNTLLKETIVHQLSILGRIPVEISPNIIGLNITYEEEDKIGLGWDYNLVKLLKSKGFRIVLRPRNWQGISPETLKAILSDPIFDQGDGLIFFGDQVLGNGNSESLKEMAHFLEMKKLFWGYTEFVGQKGEAILARLVPSQTIRVHSIPPDEIKNYTPLEARERFLRAVKERSIRLLYVRFFTEPEVNLWGKNYSYLTGLFSDIVSSGFTRGTVHPLTPFEPPLTTLVLFSISVAITFALLYSYFLPGKWIILIISLFVLLGTLFQDQMLNLRIIGALSGITYPSLAIFFLIDGFRSQKNLLLSILIAFGIIFAGGLIVSCGLYHWLYVLRIEQYSGVKTSFVIPIFLVILYLFRSGYFNRSIRSVVLGTLKRYEFVILMILAGGFVVYLTRSGNFPLLPAGMLESKMRLWLERLLFMRPRTKEFMIGYPALWLLLSFRRFHYQPLFKIVLWLGVTIGFITFFNSFCHIHTPFLFILLRFFNAFILSLVVFVIYYLIIRIAYWIWKWLGQFGENNVHKKSTNI